MDSPFENRRCGKCLDIIIAEARFAGETINLIPNLRTICETTDCARQFEHMEGSWLHSSAILLFGVVAIVKFSRHAIHSGAIVSEAPLVLLAS